MRIKILRYFIIAIFLIFIVINFACEKSTRSNSSPNYAQTEWLIFRGNPQLTGIATGELPESFQLRWTFKTEDAIKSTPVIGSGKAFVGSDDGKVYALDLKTGQKIWEYNANSAMEASPLLIDECVIVGTISGKLLCLEAKTGQFKWEYVTKEKITGSANRVSATGSGEKWIIFGCYDFAIHCVSLTSGQLIWRHETDNYINGTPATDGKSIIFGGCDGLVHQISSLDGKTIAEVDVGSYIPGSTALAETEAFAGQYENKLVCVDLANQKIKWEYGDPEKGEPFFSSPAVDKKQVIVGSRDQMIHCIDRQTGQNRWKFNTRGEVDSSPVICDDKIIVGSEDGFLYLLNLDDGKLIWSYEIGSAITGSPALADGMILIGAEDGRIYAFGEK
jgi:outer membrane protein assembly factor BamB